MRRAALVFAPLCALVGLSALGPGVAGAQPAGGGAPPGQPLVETLSGPAKDAYDSAVVLVNNGDCAHAIAKYRQAYDLSKDPRLLFDMALCDRDLRAYAEMRPLFPRYEKESGAELSGEDRADGDRALETIKSLIGAVHVTVSENGAEGR